MEVNGSRGRLDRKTSKEKSVKKEVHKRKREIAGSVELQYLIFEKSNKDENEKKS